MRRLAPAELRRARSSPPTSALLAGRAAARPATIRSDAAWGWVYQRAPRPRPRPSRRPRAVGRRAPGAPGPERPVRRPTRSRRASTSRRRSRAVLGRGRVRRRSSSARRSSALPDDGVDARPTRRPAGPSPTTSPTSPAWFDEAAAALEEHRPGEAWRPLPPEGVDAWNDAEVRAAPGHRRPTALRAAFDAGRDRLTRGDPGDARRRVARSGGLQLGLRGPPRPRPGPPRDDRTVCCASALADWLTATSGGPNGDGARADAATAESEQPRADRPTPAATSRKSPAAAATPRPGGHGESTPAARPRRSTATRRPGRLTIERIVAVDSPREFRLHPRDRVVAYTAGGRRRPPAVRHAAPRRPADPGHGVGEGPSPTRSGRPTAGGSPTSAATRSGSSTPTAAATSSSPSHPAGVSLPALVARRPAAGVRLAAPRLVPGLARRRAGPAPRPAGARPAAAGAAGADRDRLRRRGLRVVGRRARRSPSRPFRAPDHAARRDPPRRRRERRRSGGSPAAARSGRRARGRCPDGGFLYLSDADGWFQVVRLAADGRERTVLTTGQPRARRAQRRLRLRAAALAGRQRASPTSTSTTRSIDLVVAPIERCTPVKRGRGRPPKNPPPLVAAADGPGRQPVAGRLAVGRLDRRTGRGSRRSARARSRPQDLWLLPVPGVAPAGVPAAPGDDARLPAVLGGGVRARTARSPASGSRSRPATGCGSRARSGGPPTATGQARRDAGCRRSSIPTAARRGRPTGRGSRSSSCSSARASRSSTSTSAARPATAATSARRTSTSGATPTRSTWSTPARWAADQPWCDGRLAIYGGSYGGYLVLCALVEEPGLWRAGVDLYGDSEIAESFRHGDRPGRLDLARQMGAPDDPRKSRVLPARVAGLPGGADRGAAAASSTAARTSGSCR